MARRKYRGTITIEQWCFLTVANLVQQLPAAQTSPLTQSGLIEKVESPLLLQDRACPPKKLAKKLVVIGHAEGESTGEV